MRDLNGMAEKCRAMVAVAVAFAGVSSVMAAEVYPTPQKIEFNDTETGAVRKVKVVLRGEAQGEDRRASAWGILGNRAGAYALEIADGVLEVYANDEDGLYYAKQTLSQLMCGVGETPNMQRDPFPGKSIEEVAHMGKPGRGKVYDWPDIPYRGVVEGYYGIPWSAQARMSVFAFMGRNKMNTYIYAPKDDPYHHGEGCYKPYPADKAQEIRELVACARRNHVHFVWAIHPANTVRWAQENGKQQLDALCSKMQSMYDLGVRDFGVLVDDSSGEIGQTSRQVQLLNYLVENFIRKHKDVGQMVVMCPTGYNKSWANPDALRELGRDLVPEARIMWTGDSVVHDITLSGQQWVNRLVGENRPTFIWWNWPCNDFKSGRLSMGRAYGMGQEPEMLTQMSGFVANPMQQAEANKVGLFGVADYTWNIRAFDSEKSWKAGVERLYPEHRKAMQVFCDHNSYLLPNGHGYEREESVRMMPVVEQYLRSLASGTPDPDAAGRLRAEFKSMEKSGRELLAGEPELAATIEPWLKQFERLGTAGQLALDAVGEKSGGLKSLFKLGKVLREMKKQVRDGWNGSAVVPVADVEVGSRIMAPLLRQVYTVANKQAFAELAHRPSAEPVFTTNRGDAKNNAAALFDNDTRSFWSNNATQQVGDWLCLDLGAPQDVRRICLRMGGPRANDYAESGQFEISEDGRTWRAVGTERCGPDATLNLTASPLRARYVRYRITQARSNWLCVYEFSVNRLCDPMAKFAQGNNPSLTAAMSGGAVSINRVMEVHSLPKDAAIELILPTSLVVKKISIDLGDADLAKWGKLEATTEEGEKRTLALMRDKTGAFVVKNPGKDPLRSLRLINTGDRRDVLLNCFSATPANGLGQGEAELLVDGDLSTAISCDTARAVLIPCPARAKTAIVVAGDAATSRDVEVVGCEPMAAKRGSIVSVFRLTGKEKSIKLRLPKRKGKTIHEVIFE